MSLDSALGELKDARAVDAIVACLRPPTEDMVRTSAAAALARIGGPGAQQALMQAVHEDDSLAVRAAAARGLASVAGIELAETFVAELNEPDADRRKIAVLRQSGRGRAAR